MTAKKIQSKTDVAASHQQAIHGVQTYLPNRTLVLNTKPMTSETVVGLLQQQIDAGQASTAARHAWLQAVANERATTKAISAPLLAALRHYVAAMFGVHSNEYLAFGFQPPKPRAKSPTTKVLGAARNRATRKARNTMGSKQRLAVTGAAPTELTLALGITPTTAPAVTSAQPVATTPVATGAPVQPTETVTVTIPTTSGAATK
jgi:hypothetical protein